MGTSIVIEKRFEDKIKKNAFDYNTKEDSLQYTKYISDNPGFTSEPIPKSKGQKKRDSSEIVKKGKSGIDLVDEMNVEI